MGIAAATYSLSVTGVSAHNPFQPANHRVSDAVTASAGAEQQAMQLGTVFWIQANGGPQTLQVFDAERCIPGVLRVTRKLYG